MAFATHCVCLAEGEPPNIIKEFDPVHFMASDVIDVRFV